MIKTMFSRAVLVLAVSTTLSFASPPTPPAGQVAVYRDNWGIPHIYAEREADAFYGVGYALAQDNLTGILNTYLSLIGGLAAVYGPEVLDTDINSHQWRFLEEGKAAFENLPDDEQEKYRAFVAGVTKFIGEHQRELPAWVPKIEPWYPLAASHRLSSWISIYQIGQGISDCVLGGAPVDGGPYQSLYADYPPPPHGKASNQWLLMPDRTESGAVMLWADPHVPFDSGRDEIRIHAGNMHTSGVVFPGMIIPVMAQTDGVAWAYTVGGPDVSDCYEIETVAGHPRQYAYDGEIRNMVVKEVTIEINGRKPEQRTFEYVEINGVLAPVLGRAGNRAYVVATSYAGRGAAFDKTLFGMNRAKSIDQLRAALREDGMIPENVMAGDVEGNGYYVLAGRTPIRPEGYDWRKPVPGNSSATAWKGYHDLDDLVQVLNPGTGYMFNTNTASDTVAPDEPALQASAYPAYVFNDVAGRMNERGLRARELLENAKNVDFDKFVQMGMDEKLYWTAAWQSALRGISTTPMSSAAMLLATDLAKFDGFLRKESRQALQWHVWRSEISALCEQRSVDVRKLIDAVTSATSLGPMQSTLLADGLERASTLLDTKFKDQVFGDIYRIGRSNVSLPIGGVRIDRQESTLRAFTCRKPDADGTCTVVSGQRHPMLTVFSKPIQTWSALPHGQSSQPGSNHVSDQSVLASERRLKPTLLHWEDLKTHVKSATILDAKYK